jgi:hypothetical protein
LSLLLDGAMIGEVEVLGGARLRGFEVIAEA